MSQKRSIFAISGLKLLILFIFLVLGLDSVLSWLR